MQAMQLDKIPTLNIIEQVPLISVITLCEDIEGLSNRWQTPIYMSRTLVPAVLSSMCLVIAASRMDLMSVLLRIEEYQLNRETHAHEPFVLKGVAK